MGPFLVVLKQLKGHWLGKAGSSVYLATNQSANPFISVNLVSSTGLTM